MAEVAFIENRIGRETEKAVLCRICNMRGYEVDIWLPKSQIEITAQVISMPRWLHTAKARENSGLVELSPSIAAEMIAA